MARKTNRERKGIIVVSGQDDQIMARLEQRLDGRDRGMNFFNWVDHSRQAGVDRD